MLSKAKIKLITSLSHKKYRDESGLFVAEGVKTALELLPHFPCEILCASADFLKNNNVQAKETVEVSADELRKISFLKTPQGVLGVFSQKRDTLPTARCLSDNGGLSLALDGVQDPGNVGTIVRIADWFGIKDIFCSMDCADVFNPKTVQATMGALGRVRVHYVDLAQCIKENDIPIFGTFLNGENIYNQELPDSGIIVMGSEGNGISPEVEKLITNRLFIPPYPIGEPTSESLNVATATAVVCAEFRRRRR